VTGSTGRLGVDVGTSHTVAVLAAADGRIRPLLFDDGTPLLRSAVYADPGGELLVGRDAVRRAGLDPSRYEPHPKQHIDDTAVLLGDREVPVAQLLAAVLRRVGDEAARVAGGVPGEVVLTVPAVWGPPRRQLMLDAAAAAGLRGVTLTPEPVAAAAYFATVLGARIADGEPLAVFDFGGGTLDVAVVRRTGAEFTVLATGGLADLGGLDLDATIVRHLGAAITAADGRAWQRLLTPASTEDRRASRLLWDDVRIAKETLSRTTMAPVQIPGLTAEPHLTRDEFEALAGPLLSRAVAETIRVLGVAGCRPERLAGLFLVGGSSRVPLVARMLHAGLGVAPTVLEQPEMAVAEGAVRPLGAAPAPAPARVTAAVAPAPARHVPLPPGFTQPLPTLTPPPSGQRVPSLPSHPPHPVPPAAPAPPPRPPRPRRSKRTRRLLLGILAAVVALIVAVAVYVFALHPGLSMFGMPSAMRSAASPWWSVTSSCSELTEGNTSAGSINGRGLKRSTGETTIDSIAHDSRDTWECTISPGVSDSTTAAYLVFLYDSPSEGDSSQRVENSWKLERTKYYDPDKDRGTSYITQRGSKTDHGLVSVFWFRDDLATDPVSAFLVSKPNGDYTKLLDFWHQHAVVDKTPS
jgi:molecular chaperone HscA